jgi:hypothetical protein
MRLKDKGQRDDELAKTVGYCFGHRMLWCTQINLAPLGYVDWFHVAVPFCYSVPPIGRCFSGERTRAKHRGRWPRAEDAFGVLRSPGAKRDPSLSAKSQSLQPLKRQAFF